MLLYSKKYAALTRAGTGEEAMGFFNELKDAWNSGGGIVTKTIEATNREAGLKKVQTVAEMRAKGYELVNEISEQGVIEKIHLSTRPDYISVPILDNLKSYGVDVIELGVQSFADPVLRASGRGHDAACVYESCALI